MISVKEPPGTMELEVGVRVWELVDSPSVVVQKIVPQKRVPEVLEELYGGLSGGHLGTKKMLEKVIL